MVTVQLLATSGTSWTVTEGPRNFASVYFANVVYWSTTFILGWVAEFWKAASGVVQVVKDVF